MLRKKDLIKRIEEQAVELSNLKKEKELLTVEVEKQKVGNDAIGLIDGLYGKLEAFIDKDVKAILKFIVNETDRSVSMNRMSFDDRIDKFNDHFAEIEQLIKSSSRESKLNDLVRRLNEVSVQYKDIILAMKKLQDSLDNYINVDDISDNIDEIRKSLNDHDWELKKIDTILGKIDVLMKREEDATFIAQTAEKVFSELKISVPEQIKTETETKTEIRSEVIREPPDQKPREKEETEAERDLLDPGKLLDNDTTKAIYKKYWSYKFPFYNNVIRDIQMEINAKQRILKTDLRIFVYEKLKKYKRTFKSAGAAQAHIAYLIMDGTMQDDDDGYLVNKSNLIPKKKKEEAPVEQKETKEENQNDQDMDDIYKKLGAK